MFLTNREDFLEMCPIRKSPKYKMTDFYINHEGFVSSLDEELIEEDYDDIQEKKFTKIAQKGWLGIGDKYWITSLIPPKNKEFKTTFDFKNKFRANFIMTEPLTLNENGSIEDKLQIIVAAKRVDVIDGYAKELNIENFFINIGGEIRAEGMKNKNFWKIGIENPLPNQQDIFKPYEFKQSLSIATSGNYRNPGHIVGIKENKIDQNVLSISVIDKKSTAYADALATGLFALGEVDSIKNNIIDNGIPAFLIFKNNEKLQSFESKQWKELLQ